MRLELLAYATESADDAHRRFKRVFEDCTFEIEVCEVDISDMDLDTKQQRDLQSAKNALTESLRYLEMFESGGADDGTV